MTGTSPGAATGCAFPRLAAIQLACCFVGGRDGFRLLLIVKHRDARRMASRDRTDRARLLTDAERIVQSIPDDYSKSPALRGIAEALAATDPDRTEDIARSIIHDAPKALALSGVANSLVARSS
jgi:hypothetical protein